MQRGGRVVNHASFLCESVFCQTRLERFIAVEPLTWIEKKFWRPPEDKTNIFSGALQAVIQDPQNLFVVGRSRLRIIQLEEVHHLVEAN